MHLKIKIYYLKTKKDILDVNNNLFIQTYNSPYANMQHEIKKKH